ncbi:T9SS type A sorting domain-containing protein [Dysgonomonas termitidis]|uniref:T9SS type A sorting domain-containing protein n=1 Tax=Dysgonomonas termitidis TaxID=1516126 RepID=A0ABV9KZS6_9BACT
MRKQITLLLILAICSGSLLAQSPGGVGSPELWFRTKPAGTDLNGNYRWQDFSGDSLHLNVYDSRGASYGDEFTNSSVRHYNGNPALSLNKLLDAKSREVQLKRTNLSQATIIGVFAPNANFDKEMLLYGLNGRPGQGVFVTTNKIIPSIESGKSKFDFGESQGMDLMYSSNDPEGSLNVFHEKSLRIAAYYRSVPPSTGLWGERDKAVLTFGSIYSSNNVNNNSRFSLSSSENRAFTGYIPELIAYNRLLAPLERRQVDSYLAIKYGLSLPVSFIGSNGQLLWDYDAEPTYNNRITAIYRDNASGLYQRESGTSFEELPNYSDLNDYYHLGNPNYRSSASRLLVVGRQFANKTKDGEYIFWGDNNASVKLKEIEGVLGMKIMSRKWLVRTNITATNQADKQLEWQVTDLSSTVKGFVTTLRKPSSGNSQGTAFTQKPLVDTKGYLGVSGISLSGNLYIKLGNNQTLLSPGSHDYGYYISGSKVYPIVSGVVSETSIYTLIFYSTLELEKDDSSICLRIDGQRIPASEITITPQDINKQFYGAVCLTNGTFDSQVDIRHGGFVDTGNRIELSYSSNRASEFKDNDKGRSFLLIDHTGTGNFDLNTVDMIEVDDIDISRQKAIFNNVFLNTGDVFTFAYRESGLAGEIVITDPACNQSNGEITVQIKQGIRAFIYTLTDLATGQVVKSGRENSYTIHLTGLKGGNYELKISEAGGFNLENIDPAIKPTRAKTTNCLPVFEGALEWTISNITDTYMIGYTTFIEDVNNTKNIIHYGLKKQADKLYVVTNGKAATSPVTTLAIGDVIRIEKTMSGLKYKKNGTQIATGSISLLDYLLKFYGLIDTGFGPAEILNVNATGFFNLADYNWTRMDNMKISHSDGASLTYTLTLNDPCGTNSVQLQPETLQEKTEDKLKLSYIQGSMTVKAEIEFEEPDVVSFTVFNLNGNLIQKKNLTTPQRIQVADLDVPAIGVYIIKAITTNGEYTKKLLIQ